MALGTVKPPLAMDFVRKMCYLLSSLIAGGTRWAAI
jgi:hypothetical protein